MISRDSIRLESPAAKEELAFLQSMTVGDTREGVLLPALEVGMRWELVLSTADRWEFDGTFFGQPMYRLTIRKDAALLTLTVEEAK